MSSDEIPTVYECRRCWSIIPYPECPHNCLLIMMMIMKMMGFGDDMATFLEDIKGQKVNIVEAPAPEVLELIPDPLVEGQEFQSYHLKQDGEEVPDDVETLMVYEVSPGVYEPVENIMAEAQEVYHLNFRGMSINEEERQQDTEEN